MRSLAIFLGFCVSAVLAQPGNYTGWVDTTIIGDFSADSTKYTPWRPLSQYEDVRVLLVVDDSGEAGFADDSVYFAWHYQLGVIAVDSSGDTAIVPGDQVLIDSVNSAHFGVVNSGVTDSLGMPVITPSLGVDTLGLSGYATMQRPVKPFYAPFWRQKFVGVSGNNVSGHLFLRYQESRRVYVPTNDRR